MQTINQIKNMLKNPAINLNYILSTINGLNIRQIQKIAISTKIPVFEICKLLINKYNEIGTDKTRSIISTTAFCNYFYIGSIINKRKCKTDEAIKVIDYMINKNIYGPLIITSIDAMGPIKYSLNYDDIINWLQPYLKNEFVMDFVIKNKHLMKNRNNIETMIEIVNIL